MHEVSVSRPTITLHVTLPSWRWGRAAANIHTNGRASGTKRLAQHTKCACASAVEIRAPSAMAHACVQMHAHIPSDFPHMRVVPGERCRTMSLRAAPLVASAPRTPARPSVRPSTRSPAPARRPKPARPPIRPPVSKKHKEKTWFCLLALVGLVLPKRPRVTRPRRGKDPAKDKVLAAAVNTNVGFHQVVHVQVAHLARRAHSGDGPRGPLVMLADLGRRG